MEGPLKGKQGLVKHIFNGMLFIHDPCRTEHAGFICTKVQSCLLVGGSNNRNVGDVSGSRLGAPSRSPSSQFRGPPRRVASSQFSGWSFGGRGQGHGKILVGKHVKVKSGPYKGYHGRVVGFKGVIVRVELESLMKTINFSRDQIIAESGTPAPAPALSEARSLPGARTPRTPLHTVLTPMRDVGATPTPGGMRTTSGSDGARYRR
ncbi:putative transcription elongation factor SPT5 homolog 1 [Carex rostrata]